MCRETLGDLKTLIEQLSWQKLGSFYLFEKVQESESVNLEGQEDHLAPLVQELLPQNWKTVQNLTLFSFLRQSISKGQKSCP